MLTPRLPSALSYTAQHMTGGKFDLLLPLGTNLKWVSSQPSSLRTMKMSWQSEFKLEIREKKNQRLCFTYRALSKWWKPTLTESELMKMILKNINPYQSSQLHNQINTVDECVILGFRLEKDSWRTHDSTIYEGRMTQPSPQRPTFNRLAERPPVQCWRCKGQHPPGHCPLYSSPQSTPSSSQHPSARNNNSFQTQRQGVPSSNNALSITLPSKPSNKSPSKHVAIPQQLLYPLLL